MSICGRGWGEKCAKANRYTNCVCSCDGTNHGVYWEFRKTWETSHTTIPPPSVATDDDDGEIIPQDHEDWLDRVVHDRAAFTAGLKELGLDEKTVDDALSHFSEATRQAAAWSLTKSWFFRTEEERLAFKKFMYSRIAKSSLAGWIGLLDRRVEETISKRVEIPLFKLHSPKVQGSKVSYVESEVSATVAPWSITIFGSGTGKSQKVAVRYRHALDCSNGDCKLIFVPITMKVEKVATYLRGEFIGRGLRAEMILEHSISVRNGIESLAEEECSSEVNTAEDFEYEADYSRDSSNDTHRVEWTGTWSDTTELKIGLSAFQSTAECRTTVTREREIGLVFVLPAGHRYQLKQCREVRGIAWAVDRERRDDMPVRQSTDLDSEERSEAAPAGRVEASPDRDSGRKERSALRQFLDSIGDKLLELWKELKK